MTDASSVQTGAGILSFISFFSNLNFFYFILFLIISQVGASMPYYAKLAR
jgi:hypothetical protein